MLKVVQRCLPVCRNCLPVAYDPRGGVPGFRYCIHTVVHFQGDQGSCIPKLSEAKAALAAINNGDTEKTLVKCLVTCSQACCSIKLVQNGSTWRQRLTDLGIGKLSIHYLSGGKAYTRNTHADLLGPHVRISIKPPIPWCYALNAYTWARTREPV